ncbi:MAG: acyltransferase family protein [Oceanicaulis sp.]
MAAKLEWIQVLRATAAVLVLIAHLGQQDAERLNAALMPLWTMAGVSGVDLFFVISGFVMVYVTRHAPHGSRSFAARFLYARATRVYPAYWLATLGVIAGYAVFGEPLGRGLGELNILTSLALWPDWGLPVLMVGWTLIHELYFYLVFALLLLAPRRFLPLLLALWLAAVVTGGFFVTGRSGPWLQLIAHPLTAEFALGCAAGLLVTSGRRALAPASVGVGLLWWIAASASVSWAGAQSVPAGWDRVLLWGVPAALIVYGAACLDIDRSAKAPAALVRVGDWSYALYLVHLPLIVAMGVVWAAIPLAGPLASAGFVITTSVLCLAGAAAMHHLFEKPVLGLTRKAGDRIFPAARPVAETPLEATKIW